MGSHLSRLHRAVADRVAVDTRALAAFRIALGSLLLVDLVRRAGDLRALYTDAGAVPRSALREVYPLLGDLSLHALSGTLWWQALLFTLAGAAALALLIGYRARAAAAVSLVLLLSVQARNPALLNSGDTLLHRLVFWGLFLPLGERWGVDALGRADPRERVSGPATVGLLGQVVVMYATNAVVKFRGVSWPRGEATRYVFRLDQFTVLFGDALAGHPTLLRLLAWAWLALLICSPLLVLATGRPRTALAGAFAAAHLGMALTLMLGLFPLVAMAALVPFLPASVWDRAPSCRPRVVAAVARLRRALGAAPLLPRAATERPGGQRARRAGRVLATAAVAALVLVNAVGLGVVAAPSGTPDRVTEPSWDVFAPSPPRVTVWFAAPATLESGRVVDARTGEAVDWTPERDLERTYGGERWRKLLNRARDDPALRRALADYRCARWNRTHDDRMVNVSLVAVTAPVDPDVPDDQWRHRYGPYRCERA